MTTPQSDIEKLTAQVARLQRKISYLKWYGALAIGVVLTTFIFGQTAPVSSQPVGNRVVEAEKFVLKDSKGRIRGVWEVEDFEKNDWNRVILRLRSAEGKVATVLQNPSWGSASLELLDRSTVQSPGELWHQQLLANEPRDWPNLDVDSSGTEERMPSCSRGSLSAEGANFSGKAYLPHLFVGLGNKHWLMASGPNGVLALTNEEGPGIWMSSKDGKIGGGLVVSESNIQGLVRENDKLRLSLQVGSTVNRLALHDDTGRFRAVVGTMDTMNETTGETRSRRESSLLLFGEDGKVVFSAP